MKIRRDKSETLLYYGTGMMGDIIQVVESGGVREREGEGVGGVGTRVQNR
jgi:hypothetical protein